MIDLVQLVVVESPLRGRSPSWAPKWLASWFERRDRASNRRYALACMRDCIRRKQAPYASHVLFDQPGLLDDADPSEREQGIRAGFYWGACAGVRAFYIDRGVSTGMLRGMEEARRRGQRIVFRELGPQWADERVNEGRAWAEAETASPEKKALYS